MISPINTHNEKKILLETQTLHCVPGGALTGALTESEGKYPWSEKIVKLAEDLLDTAVALEKTALGVAAPQIWKEPNLQCPSMFVMRWPTFEHGHTHWGWMIVINPEVKLSGKKVWREEGCLSLPGNIYRVQRRSNAELTYCTIDSLEPKTVKFYGAVSNAPFIIQHEMDHLNGTLICKTGNKRRI